MSTSIEQPLWEPSEDLKQRSNIARYMRWLEEQKGQKFETREDLWKWSVEHVEDFWASLWVFFDIQASQPYTTVLSGHKMPGAQWFSGARLNYAEHAFRNVDPEQPALFFRSERHSLVSVTWKELAQKVGAVARSLRNLRVKSKENVTEGKIVPSIENVTMTDSLLSKNTTAPFKKRNSSIQATLLVMVGSSHKATSS